MIFTLLLAFSLPFVQQSREITSHQLQLKREFAQWQPGPNVAAELMRLEAQDSELWLARRERGNDDPRARLELSRERERLSVKQLFIRVIAFASQRDEVPDVVVIQWAKDEARRVFPRGLAHVGETKAGEIVPVEPGSSRCVRYWGTKKGIWKWTIFERVRD